MKSRILILSVSAALAGSPAYGAWTDTAPVKTVSSAWSQVKKTVNTWVDYYWGGKKDEPAQATSSSSTAAQPAAGQTAAAPVATPPAAPSQSAATTAPLAPKIESEAAKQLRDQPLFTEKAQGSTLQDVKAVQAKVKAQQVLKVEAGRVGTTQLPKSKAGVPVSNFAKMAIKGVKRIPRLDIGTESLVSKEDFQLGNLRWDLQKPSEFKKLPQPNPVAESEIKPWLKPVAKLQGPKDLLAAMRNAPHPVTMEMVQKITWTFGELKQISELAYKPLNDDQLKMLASLILFNKGKHCPMVLGLFHQLQAKEGMKLEASYHLGACAAELKMHQAAYDNLSKVIAADDKDYAQSAMTILAKNLLPIYEKDFFKLVKTVKNLKSLETEGSRDYIAYRAAKGAYRLGEHKSSLAFAEQVSAKSDYHSEAQFLQSMNKFALGDKAAALKKLQELWAVIGKGGNSTLRALTNLNLARMYFSQKKFDKALEHYMQVPKDHPLWVEALIEQGWTQLASDDFAGAIGNMYSLHSPYFKAVYQPESFVVRTIGYLNICQYGDAYKSLSFIEKDYRDWYNKTSKYLENKSEPLAVYNTVKNYIRGKSSDDVDGVPFQIWREAAHRKDFLNIQTALNDKIDEAKRFEGIAGRLNEERAAIKQQEEQTKRRFDQMRSEVAKAKGKTNVNAGQEQGMSIDDMKSALRQERNYTIGYRYQLALLENARQGFAGFQQACHARIDKESSGLAQRAGESLLAHTKGMQKEMARVLENNEFLRYEVFSGSGENIRYQVSGGQVAGNNRVPAHIKPTKMMNWQFDGEFWEDEIGSYRSSLQNNCPKNGVARKAVPGTAREARHTDEDSN